MSNGQDKHKQQKIDAMPIVPINRRKDSVPLANQYGDSYRHGEQITEEYQIPVTIQGVTGKMHKCDEDFFKCYHTQQNYPLLYSWYRYKSTVSGIEVF